MRTRLGFWMMVAAVGGVACEGRSRRPDSAVGVAPIVRGPVPRASDGGGLRRACGQPGSERTAALCANHYDDDCDGWEDCADLDCVRAQGVRCLGDAATPPPSQTTQCVLRGPENTAAACADHLDDDCDGYVDCADFDCRRALPACAPADAGPPPRAPVDAGPVDAGPVDAGPIDAGPAPAARQGARRTR